MFYNFAVLTSIVLVCLKFSYANNDVVKINFSQKELVSPCSGSIITFDFAEFQIAGKTETDLYLPGSSTLIADIRYKNSLRHETNVDEMDHMQQIKQKYTTGNSIVKTILQYHHEKLNMKIIYELEFALRESYVTQVQLKNMEVYFC